MYKYFIRNQRFTTENSFAGNGRSPFNSQGSDVLSPGPVPGGHPPGRPFSWVPVFFFFLVLLAGCTDFTGEDWSQPRNIPELGGSDVIENYDLQAYVPVPVAGQEPITSHVQGNLEVTVVWKNDKDETLESLTAFQEGVVYKADITLETRNNYIFDPAINFKYHSNSVQDQPKDMSDPVLRKLSPVTYYLAKAMVEDKKKLIGLYDLQYLVPIPATGGVPVISVERGDMNINVIWKGTNEDPITITDSFKFAAETEYRAEITLQAKTLNNYVFEEGTAFYYAPGTVKEYGTTTPAGLSSEEYRKVSVIYKNTAKAIELIPGFDLAGYIPPPSLGNEATLGVTDTADPQKYSGSVFWAKGVNSSDGKFTGGPYTASIALYANSGYSFADNCGFTYLNWPEEYIHIQPSPGGDAFIMVVIDFLPSPPVPEA